MKWFEGTIPSAIVQAKAKEAIFIVYISGSDDVSKQMDATWSSDEVGEVCEQNQCVAIRLAANSDSCAQFCVIYPVVCVPCTFFIGENGVPLEVTGGHVESAQFVEKISQVLQMHQSQKSGQKVVPLQKSPEGAAPSTTVSTPQDAAPSGGPSTESTSEGDGGSASEMNASAGPSAPIAPLDDRIKKAKELVAQKREEKLRKEAEEQKQKEKERLQVAKDVAKLRTSQEERARKEAVDEWKKEKEEKKREKERIREQLARDRAEKAAKYHAERAERDRSVTERERLSKREQTDRETDTKQRDCAPMEEQLEDDRKKKSAAFHSDQDEKQKKMEERRHLREQREADVTAQKQRDSEQVKEQLSHLREEKAMKFRKEKEDRDKCTQEAKRAKLEVETANQAKADAAKMERARIQFRLPDGSSITNQFSSSDTLQTAREFVQQNVGSTYGQFSLSTHYPKRDFTEADMSQTLLELDLAPSAVVIVLPGSRSVVSRPSGSSEGGGFLLMLFAPFMALWTFLYGLLFGAPTQPRGAYNSSQQGEPQAASQDGGDNSSQRNRPKSSSGLRRRQEGNITRLSALQDDDDDEDRPTWNGNSTQQM